MTLRNTLISLVCVACSGGMNVSEAASPSGEDREIRVFVSIVPQMYLVERIGGEIVQVQALVPRNQDPHTFEVAPRRVMDLARAQLYLTIGMPFEVRLKEKLRRVSEHLRFVDITSGIAGPDETHGHSHDADPHVWLSPPLLRVLAENTAAALIEADPSRAEGYRERLTEFVRDIEEVHSRIGAILEPFRGSSFYVFHPDLGWFAEAYGLEQRAIQAEGKAPAPRQLHDLIRRAKADGARTIFVQPQFDTSSAEAVAAAVGAECIPFDPMEKDILRNLDRFVRVLSETLSR